MQRKILLVLSPKHQKKLGYSTRSIEDDLDLVLGTDYDLNNLSDKDKVEIKTKVRDNLRIAKGYIEEYYVGWSGKLFISESDEREWRGTLHIRPTIVEVL